MKLLSSIFVLVGMMLASGCAIPLSVPHGTLYGVEKSDSTLFIVIAPSLQEDLEVRNKYTADVKGVRKNLIEGLKKTFTSVFKSVQVVDAISKQGYTLEVKDLTYSLGTTKAVGCKTTSTVLGTTVYTKSKPTYLDSLSGTWSAALYLDGKELRKSDGNLESFHRFTHVMSYWPAITQVQERVIEKMGEDFFQKKLKTALASIPKQMGVSVAPSIKDRIRLDSEGVTTRFVSRYSRKVLEALKTALSSKVETVNTTEETPLNKGVEFVLKRADVELVRSGATSCKLSRSFGAALIGSHDISIAEPKTLGLLKWYGELLIDGQVSANFQGESVGHIESLNDGDTGELIKNLLAVGSEDIVAQILK